MSRSLRARVARRLRFAADRIDPAGAPRAMSVSFTFEERTGIVFRDDGRGCRLWRYGDADYKKAHGEAGPAASGSTEIWLPQRVPAGTALTGRHREPAPPSTASVFAMRFTVPKEPG